MHGHCAADAPRSHGVRRTGIHFLGLSLAATLLLLAPLPALAAGRYTLIGWNNLGMHCMDGDYGVLSLLPPFNTIHAQLVDPSGRLIDDPIAAGITVTYQGVADPDGSINTTSLHKTNFWEHVLALFGASLPVDAGLFGKPMPGAGNPAIAMDWDAAGGWFKAEGIPITPYDDSGVKNYYPLMRLVARTSSGAVLATTDIVLPVSDEMDCKSCHRSDSAPAARPAGGWVGAADPERDVRLNILRLHDERQAGDPLFTTSLAAVGYDPRGLEATVTEHGQSILCASCHLSEALPNSGRPGVERLTRAIHARHANAPDPLTGLTMDSSSNRSACYRCHPGSVTRCLRGAMGSAVAQDGSLEMQCQSCHGTMSTVGNSTRLGWVDEPSCQNCHTGTAIRNAGEIRFTSAFDAPGHLRAAVDARFATNADTPAPGLDLYRFSKGHGDLKCEACHGSTHAEFPSSHRNDNLQSIALQGHAGALVECVTCHPTTPATVSGGPHGMHPVGQDWVDRHHDEIELAGGTGPCRDCHGADYRGTPLSRVKADRLLSAEQIGTRLFWQGAQIGCYSCHQGPSEGDRNPNRPPVAQNASVSGTAGSPIPTVLGASDPDGDSLTVRIVSQPTHGTTGLVGRTATYFPDPGYTGADVYTFAAWDGSTESNLATVTLAVGAGSCTPTLTPPTASFSAAGGASSITVTVASGCSWEATSTAPWLTITGAASATGPAVVSYSVAPNSPGGPPRAADLTVAGIAARISQAGVPASGPDLTVAWSGLPTLGCTATRCRLRGRLVVSNVGTTRAGASRMQILLSPTGVGGQLVKEFSVPALPAGRQRVRSLTSLRLPVGVTGIGQYAVAVVDATGLVAEGDETNNSSSAGPLVAP